jgi:ribonuclease-3 family protein
VEESIDKAVFEGFSDGLEADELSPVVLAYLGDSVYEMLVRLYVLSHGSKQPDRIHRHTTGLVNAASQARMFYAVEEMLTEEELHIYKRGRNASKLSYAKNQSVGDYRKATGFEALIGWLYLKKRYSRIEELVRRGISVISGV